jgi:UDP-N-acetylmuramate: L-alanyl-gamma-D-glutamyl-meso-diaminopimelate ligase
LIAYAGDAAVREVAKRARCPVSFYALEGDQTGEVTPTWLAAPASAEATHQPFDLFYGGSACGRVLSPLAGLHNLRNALAAIAAGAEGAGLSVRDLGQALARFSGVRRRQELRGLADGVRVYDDFAHHPTAVLETLAALRARHPQGKLIALFEPRSATASRKLHEAEYPRAFEAADVVLLAPVGRSDIAEAERLDTTAIAHAIVERTPSVHAQATGSLDQLLARTLELAKPGDTVVAMSNGAFGGMHDRLLAALAERLVRARLHASARVEA